MDTNFQPTPDQPESTQPVPVIQRSGHGLLMAVGALLLLSLLANVYFFSKLNQSKMVDQPDGPQIPVVQTETQLTATTTPIMITDTLSQVDSSTGWKLYTSPTYKITVKYPAEWRYDDTTKNFIIFTPQDTDPMGQVIPGIYFSILRENYAEAVKSVESAFGTEQENINVGNLNGIHIQGLAGGAYILKNNDGKVFEFRYAVIDNFQEVARQMMKSLVLN